MDLPAPLRFNQVIQSGEDDSQLQFAVKRYPEVMAHHKGKENRTRWFAMLGHIESNRHRNCRDTSAFNSALHERDRLVSYRSSGTQKSGLCSVRYDRIGNVFGQCLFKVLRVHLVADKRKEVWREFTNQALRSQLLQTFDRKNHVQISEGASCWILDLMNFQIRYAQRGRHSPEAEIADWMDHIERHRSPWLNTCRTDKGQPRLR